MGSCLCFGRKTTDVPEKYVENRSCTDIIFAIIFILFVAIYIVLGIIILKNGDLEGLLRGSDYLGYHCGQGEGPKDFASSIPDDAPFQSREWSENTYLWYPLPLEKSLSMLLDIRRYMALGICVKSCPKVNIEGLKKLLANITDADELKKMQVYSYGTVSIDNVIVNAASNLYSLYDTTPIHVRCLPSLKQPPELKIISTPILGKLFDFFWQGISEICSSWPVFVIEAVFAIILGFILVLMLRCCIDVLVWLMLVLVFVLLAGIGGICFFLYYTKGHSEYFKVAGVESYSTLFLVLSIIFFVAALIYLFIVIALSKKVRFVCAIIKVSGRVMGSAPTVLLVPLLTSVLMCIVCLWAILIAFCIYNFNKKDFAHSLVHVTNAVKYDNSIIVKVNQTEYFNVTSRVLRSQNALGYMFLGNIFAFLWSMAFLGAFCFTVIAFVTVFWYFSSLHDGEKGVPACGVCKAVFWTLFYHTGTLALGSLIIAIIQFLQLLLTYFAKKARAGLGNNKMVACLLCYAKCFLAYFERVIATVNHNAYVMMCITAECFCFSACRAVSLILNHASELLFLNWLVALIIFVAKLFIVCACCVSGYFLLGIESLAPGVEVKVLPLVVIGVMTLFFSSIFFHVYSSAVCAMLVCYCYDRDVNEPVGVYYVPQELEHQIRDYSQEEKVAQLNERQAAVHHQ